VALLLWPPDGYRLPAGSRSRDFIPPNGPTSSSQMMSRSDGAFLPTGRENRVTTGSVRRDYCNGLGTSKPGRARGAAGRGKRSDPGPLRFAAGRDGPSGGPALAQGLTSQDDPASFCTSRRKSRCNGVDKGKPAGHVLDPKNKLTATVTLMATISSRWVVTLGPHPLREGPVLKFGRDCGGGSYVSPY